MKKIVFIFLLLLSIQLLVGCSDKNLNDNLIERGNDIVKENPYSGSCPYSKINCGYPGECGLYLDKDQNEICDRSE